MSLPSLCLTFIFTQRRCSRLIRGLTGCHTLTDHSSQGKFLQLPRRRPGQRIEHHEIFRELIFSHPPAVKESNKVRQMQGGSAGPHAYARTAALAQTFVGHSHYGGLPHAGIFEHNIFDFAA